ncbi:hypothetical protein G6O67_001419 [Ophiocordyceps sinensis]|uniref:Uncharacterized protein n=1 Tax=Ophiocordyceps sinensis TaxID=72228 RepID=A0A8H4V8X8_9HYPO|nr:hypothetical protein G6O67_001419 [Ophiocordyceps sinensis]
MTSANLLHKLGPLAGKAGHGDVPQRRRGQGARGAVALHAPDAGLALAVGDEDEGAVAREAEHARVPAVAGLLGDKLELGVAARGPRDAEVGDVVVGALGQAVGDVDVVAVRAQGQLAGGGLGVGHARAEARDGLDEGHGEAVSSAVDGVDVDEVHHLAQHHEVRGGRRAGRVEGAVAGPAAGRLDGDVAGELVAGAGGGEDVDRVGAQVRHGDEPAVGAVGDDLVRVRLVLALLVGAQAAGRQAHRGEPLDFGGVGHVPHVDGAVAVGGAEHALAALRQRQVDEPSAGGDGAALRHGEAVQVDAQRAQLGACLVEGEQRVGRPERQPRRDALCGVVELDVDAGPRRLDGAQHDAALARHEDARLAEDARLVGAARLGGQRGGCVCGQEGIGDDVESHGDGEVMVMVIMMVLMMSGCLNVWIMSMSI